MSKNGESRVVARELFRKCRRAQKNWDRSKKHRSRAMAILAVMRKKKRASDYKGERDSKKTQVVKGGTWNTRGWGVKYGGIEPYMNTECMLSLLDARGWEFCTFSKLMFTGSCVFEYQKEENTRTMIIYKKAGIA